MTYFYPLKISKEKCFDKELILKEINSEFDPDQYKIWKKWDQNSTIFSNYFISWLNLFYCHIFFAELFYTPPFQKSVWHIDTNQPSEYIKINFVWGSKKHTMQWGDSISNQLQLPNPSETAAGTKFLRFSDHDIAVIEETTIDHPSIVCIGKPHRVINFDNTGRWCLSVNIHNSHGNRLSIEEAKHLFNEYVLN